MLFELLEKAKLKRQLIAIYLYDEGFYCGILEDFNEEFIQIWHYTKFGEQDGLVVENFSNIERISFEENYLTALQLIIDNYSEIKSDKHKYKNFNHLGEEDWQYECLKHYQGDQTVLASIQINQDNFFQGFVIDLNEEFLIFKVIDSLGREDETCIFKLEDINSVKVNDLNCRKKLFLYNALLKNQIKYK